MKITAKTLTLCGVIAAAYVALTYLSAAFGLAYGPIQFRISEALTILPLFTPAAIPALTVGCFISNLTSFNPIDLLFGTAATLFAAIITRWARKITIRKFPIISFLAPVIMNALLVGLEIAIFYLDGFTMAGFLISALEVGVGELLVLLIIGTPLWIGLRKKAPLLFNN